MSKASAVTESQCIWKNNSLEVDNLYVVTFAKDFQLERIPTLDLNTWLRKIDQVVKTRLEFTQKLDQMGKEGLNETEVEVYRLSSKLYNQTCKIKNLPYIVAIHFKTQESIESLRTRVDCTYSRSSTDEVDDQAHEIIEQCWFEITKVVQKTLKELTEAPVFDRKGSVGDYEEFNTTFQKAKEVFENFSVRELKPFTFINV